MFFRLINSLQNMDISALKIHDNFQFPKKTFDSVSVSDCACANWANMWWALLALLANID